MSADAGAGTPRKETPQATVQAPPAAPASPKRRRGRSAIRDRAEHLLFAAFEGILRVLPARFAARLGGRLARLYLAVAPRRRRILMDNLAAAFHELSRQRLEEIGRASVENFGAAFIEFLESPKLSRAEIEERIEIVGLENLEAARARGKGVFFLSAHFGSWELGAVRTGLLGEPIASVMRPLDNPFLEEELTRRRTRFGNGLIRKKEAAREILKRLRSGGSVAIMIDQNVLPDEAVFVPFFGRLAATSPSLALLQMKTDATVVPTFAYPQGGGRYRVEFEKPILASDYAAAGGRDERVVAGTALYMAVTERAIRRDPSAWLWLHNRWRTRPPGE
jgi:KDO2-lipid IV(A) lauroyltransferase